MWTTSSTRTERAGLVLAFALLLPALAFASKDDDYNKAVAAAASNKVYDAAKYYCSVANADPSYKDAKLNCKIYSDQVTREDRRNEERWQNGTKAINSNDFATAEQEFHNITGGVRYDAAQAYLRKIPEMKRALDQQQGDAAMTAKFNQAVDAFNRNDFNNAPALFSQITGSRQADAQNYLNKIKKYQQAMQEGDTLAAAKNYKAAANSYNDASNIKPDGPGDPRSKIADMQQRLAAQTGTQPSGTQVATNERPVTPPPVTQPKVIESKHTVDSARVIKDAQTAAKRGDVATARQKLKTVLVLDPGNAQAKSALDALPTETVAAQNPAEPPKPAPKAGSEADAILARGITEFYKGDYDAAEVHLKDYCDLNGEKSALGYFYIAASKLTRYYLGGEKDADKKLLNDAEANFRLAKKADGFKPPERFVSPRILKVFQGV